jgi:ABC-type transporter Mla maintaining outer membrane lipid asymmetry permease subunit MlaE
VPLLTSLIARLERFFESVGDFGLFAFRVFKQVVRPPFEISEIVSQLFEVGWRSGRLLLCPDSRLASF